MFVYTVHLTRRCCKLCAMLQYNSVHSTKLSVCTAVICSTLIEEIMGVSGEWICTSLSMDKTVLLSLNVHVLLRQRLSNINAWSIRT